MSNNSSLALVFAVLLGVAFPPALLVLGPMLWASYQDEKESDRRREVREKENRESEVREYFRNREQS